MGPSLTLRGMKPVKFAVSLSVNEAFSDTHLLADASGYGFDCVRRPGQGFVMQSLSGVRRPRVPVDAWIAAAHPLRSSSCRNFILPACGIDCDSGSAFRYPLSSCGYPLSAP